MEMQQASTCCGVRELTELGYMFEDDATWDLKLERDRPYTIKEAAEEIHRRLRYDRRYSNHRRGTYVYYGFDKKILSALRLVGFKKKASFPSTAKRGRVISVMFLIPQPKVKK